MRRARGSLLIGALLLGSVAAGPCGGPPRSAHPDVDGNGVVEVDDVTGIVNCMGEDPVTNAACASADTNRDGVVDAVDFNSLTRDMGKMVCNTAVDLCDRPYDQISYPTTHNAFSAIFEGFVAANHFYGMTVQLDDGVRGLMLDTHPYSVAGSSETVFLCHGVGNCSGGNRPLLDGLLEIKAFLDARPNEVVTLIFESYVSEADTAAVFAAAGLTSRLYAHPAGATSWPTLKDMLLAGKQIVVFTDDSSASLPWHHYVWTHAWETDFSYFLLEDLGCGSPPSMTYACEDNRGVPSNDLFILNHFVTQNTGVPALAQFANKEDCLGVRAQVCQTESGSHPNFVTVDFHRLLPGFSTVYETVEFFNTVDTLNALPGF